MSSISPINVRIASRTRYLETTGDSSYYYSSQLITNMALLKALKKLGQQLSWPSKVNDTAPVTKHGSSFIAKANQSANNPRIEPLINLKATPGKEWIYANLKLIEKLVTSYQFFNSKTIGLLAKGLGRSGRFNSAYILEGEHLPFALNSKTKQAKIDNKANTWFTSFNSLAKLTKYCNYKYYRQPLQRYPAIAPRVATGMRTLLSGTLTNKQPFIKRLQNRSSLPLLSAAQRQGSKVYKKSLRTPARLPFYLTTLGLISHNLVLRNSLVITPIISGSLQSNLLLADHTKTIKSISSSGLGLVSSSPNCYIARSLKDTSLNFFFRIPAKLTEKSLKKPAAVPPSLRPGRSSGITETSKRTKTNLCFSSLVVAFNSKNYALQPLCFATPLCFLCFLCFLCLALKKAG